MAAMESGRLVHHSCHHFLILLVLCCLLSEVLAAPATRSLKSVKAYSSIQDTPTVTQAVLRRITAKSSVGPGTMDIELTDYPDPGANKGHEPVTPPQG